MHVHPLLSISVRTVEAVSEFESHENGEEDSDEIQCEDSISCVQVQEHETASYPVHESDNTVTEDFLLRHIEQALREDTSTSMIQRTDSSCIESEDDRLVEAVAHALAVTEQPSNSDSLYNLLESHAFPSIYSPSQSALAPSNTQRLATTPSSTQRFATTPTFSSTSSSVSVPKRSSWHSESAQHSQQENARIHTSYSKPRSYIPNVHSSPPKPYTGSIGGMIGSYGRPISVQPQTKTLKTPQPTHVTYSVPKIEYDSFISKDEEDTFIERVAAPVYAKYPLMLSKMDRKSNWACHLCTFINSNPLGLACEVCTAERNIESRPLTGSGPAPNLKRKISCEDDSSASKRISTTASSSAASSTSNPSALKSNSTLAYPNGALKLTAIAPYPACPKSISFMRIMEPRTQKKVFLASFQFDLPWIASHVPPNIPICIALHSSTPAPTRTQNNIQLVFPAVGTRNSIFHIKMGVLYRHDSVRVFIGSANLVDYDWNALENIVFVQDFPKKVENQDDAHPSDTGFKNDVVELLKEMGAAAWVWEGLDAFDFRACKARLVVSKPGKYSGPDLQRYGLGRLSAVTKEVAPNLSTLPNSDVSMMYTTSSLGSLSAKFLLDFEASACGRFNEAIPPTSLVPKIRVVYPTKDTVQKSFLGVNGGGTITWNASLWAACEHKKLLYDCISKRKGALSHCKILLAKETKNEGNNQGIYYCGSHNMTLSAWGKAGVIGKSKEPRLEIGNWEVGVVFSASEKLDGEGVVIPFEVENMRQHGERSLSAHGVWQG
ncbi:hypothetical protein HDU81_008102 [Chytriomyces hyalinus]|nr:hypothetical protein HDU81_008102 [Chytriomyces hyalinus]